MFYEDNTIGTHFLCYEMFVDAFIVEINDLQGSETETETNKVLEKNNKSKQKPFTFACSHTCCHGPKLHNLCP